MLRSHYISSTHVFGEKLYHTLTIRFIFYNSLQIHYCDMNVARDHLCSSSQLLSVNTLFPFPFCFCHMSNRSNIYRIQLSIWIK